VLAGPDYAYMYSQSVSATLSASGETMAVHARDQRERGLSPQWPLVPLLVRALAESKFPDRADSFELLASHLPPATSNAA
jgi:hypothetical protein